MPRANIYAAAFEAAKGHEELLLRETGNARRFVFHERDVADKTMVLPPALSILKHDPRACHYALFLPYMSTAIYARRR